MNKHLWNTDQALGKVLGPTGAFITSSIYSAPSLCKKLHYAKFVCVLLYSLLPSFKSEVGQSLVGNTKMIETKYYGYTEKGNTNSKWRNVGYFQVGIN